ncbi:hypothetical protein [Dyella kyungheensis]|uniref:Uncharacterized protein n=1 Tax=Dyella kyungheensis TaxID=1242174 RepID=A0ABS2JU67_9GAMM|nr:hypothetical protein [Dyella kyungheensis]MBM7122134.1 hypothetical protein [Dyella kyungheensis]
MSSRITALLKSAIEGGYPIYTVGLRVLADTVHLLGDEGERLNAQFVERRATTYWRSPFDSAWIADGQGSVH